MLVAWESVGPGLAQVVGVRAL